MIKEYTTLKTYNERNMHTIPQLKLFPEAEVNMMQVVSQVFPFKVNEYVLDELIDWDNPFDDAMFRLVFPHKDMLSSIDFARVEKLWRDNDKLSARLVISEIRRRLNPHPSGQMELNVPRLDGQPVPGLQHKYRQTLLVFPAKGQTCHSYCSFCFRWPQFTNEKELRFSMSEREGYLDYLRVHPEIADVLFTGGDPMIMTTDNLKSYIEPLLDEEFSHVKNIRIGTKSLSYWPQRFLNQDDSKDLLNFFEKVVVSGRQLAFMAHYNHFRELEPEVAKKAITRVRNTGAVIRSQSPIINHINNDAGIWSKMWNEQTALGIVPYYMFVERDTGAYDYFKIPLCQSLGIYKNAFNDLSGLARTARGPVMSETNGKVEVLDVIELFDRKYFVLRYVQARDISKVGKIHFAEFDASACWYSELKLVDFSCSNNNETVIKKVNSTIF